MICRECNVEKPQEEFLQNKTKKTGFETICKNCNKVYQNNWYVENRNKRLEQKKKTRKKNSILLKTLVETNKTKCQICHESRKACLDFHHIDPNNKSYDISTMHGKSEKTILKEIQKCIVLCANCYRLVHAGEIPCPGGQN